MSVPSESKAAGTIPSFPFQEISPGAGERAGVAGSPGVPDVEGLKSALESAVQALRALQSWVGVLERPQGVGLLPTGVRSVDVPSATTASTAAPSLAATPATVASEVGGRVAVEAPTPAALAPVTPVPGPVVAPREVFPPGLWEAGPGARASLTPVQQAHLDAALAQAFSVDPGPVRTTEPEAAPGSRSMQPAAAAIEREAPFALADSLGAVSPFADGRSEAANAELPTVPQPMPAPASLIAAAPPLPPHFSPFSAPTAIAEARDFQAQPLTPAPLPPPPAPSQPPPSPSVAQSPFSPQPAPASPTPAAAAPACVPPFEPAPSIGQATQPTPFPPPPGPPATAEAELASPATSTLPFSPFQGLEPAPPPPHQEVPKASSNPEPNPAWPTSPFFGSTQASTAPFRVVEPPPVIHSSVAEVAASLPPLPQIPDAPATPPPAPAPSPPPPQPTASPVPVAIPDQGQVFNFAELLRANGQR